MAVPITTINDAIPREQWTADGIRTDFFVPWPIRTLDDLKLTFGDGAIPDVPWSVVGVNDSAGFTIRFTLPPPDGTKITALRRQLLQRQQVLGSPDEFNATAYNTEWADRVMQLQELRRDVARTVKLPDEDPLTEIRIPTFETRKNKYAFFDSNGELQAAAGTGSGGSTTLDYNTFPAGTPSNSSLVAYQNGDGFKKATLEELGNYIAGIGRGLPFVTASMAGLEGDWNGTTGTDDAPALQEAINTYSALYGGATFMLRAQTGKSFYFKGRVTVKSNINLIFFSPIALTTSAGISIRGEYAAVSGKDSFALLADGVAGGTTLQVDTTPVGGGVLSSHFAVGDVVNIIGELDSAGYPLETQPLVITNINDGTSTLTFNATLTYSYKSTYPAGPYEEAWDTVNRTRLAKVKKAALSANATEGTSVVAVQAGELGNLSVGDVVLIEDDKIQSDVAGSNTSRINREMATILSIGEGGATNIKLSRRVCRDYTTAFRARLTVVNAASAATVQGATAVFTETAGATGRPTFEAVLAYRSTFANCRVPNEDTFGSRGNGFRINLCLQVDAIECEVEQPKFLAAGEGYGFYLTHATNCHLRACRGSGCRHAFIYLGATECNLFGCVVQDDRLSGFDMHGCNEFGVVAYDLIMRNVGATSASASFTALSFGNSAGLNLVRKCGVIGGLVENYNHLDAYAIWMEPQTRECFVKGVTFRNITQWFHHEDITGQGALYAEGNKLENNTVEGCSDWLLEADGGRNGASIKTCRDMLVKGNTFRKISKVVRTVKCDEFELIGNDFDEITADATFSYVCSFHDTTALRVIRNTVNGGSRGIRLQDCPSAQIINNVFCNQENTTILNEAGGCDNTEWIDNRAVGYFPTIGRHTTPSILMESPRVIRLTLADDAVMKHKAPTTNGMFFICKFGVVSPRTRVAYWAGSTPAVASFDSSGSPAITTGALTGTTGTDGNWTISAHSDGLIYVENRTGASLEYFLLWMSE